MNLEDQLDKIINDDDIKELKKFFYKEEAIKNRLYYVFLSLYYATIQGRLNILKYLFNKYSDIITGNSINESLKFANANSNLNIVRYLKFYKYIKENGIKYSNTILLG